MLHDTRSPIHRSLPMGSHHPLFASQAADLQRLSAEGKARSLRMPAGIDFSSNDYLGLAGSSRLSHAIADALVRGVPVGSGGSRLLRGNHCEHE